MLGGMTTAMCGFETRIRTDNDADRIASAFYAFVERHGDGVDGDAHLRTEIDGTGPHVLVRLWSAKALEDFQNALASAVLPPRKSAYE